jgi:N-acyl-D-amino-acid deacylase
MYPPSITASDEELVALCRAVEPYGGYYQPHHRNYGAGALKGYADSIAIARAADIPVQLTHAHLSFAPNKGRHAELLAMVDDARGAGVDVTMDSYPYLAGSTSLHAFLPSWAQSGGVDALIARLQDPALRARMRHELEVTGSDGLSQLPVEWGTLVLSNASRAEHRPFIGLSMVDGAERQGKGKPPFDFYADLVAAERGGAGCLLFCGNEENVRAIMQHPAHMAGSDGLVMGDRPHPRAWGTFIRYLAHYSGELRLVSFEEMVRKMTALPAHRLGLSDRGVVRAGAAADLVVLDRASLADRSTYEEPRRGPSGVRHVLVNGAFTRRGGRTSATRSGQVLRRQR